MEHLAHLAGVRSIAKFKRALFLSDSDLALGHVLGYFSYTATTADTLEPIGTVTSSVIRCRLAQENTTTTFGHIKGHNGTAPNYADLICTTAQKTKCATGDATLFADVVLNAPRETLQRTWLPSALPVLSDADLSSFWDSRAIGDRFAIRWSLSDKKVEAWTGEKLGPTKVLYATDSHTVEERWPPQNGVRVHALHFLTAETRRGKEKGLRLKHSTPATFIEYDSDAAIARLRAMQPSEWVEFCAGSKCRRTLPSSHWETWSSITRGALMACISSETEKDFVDNSLFFFAIPNLYLDTRLKNKQLLEVLQRRAMLRQVSGSQTYSNLIGNELDEDDRAVLQAQKLGEQGFISKACKALGRNRVLDASVPAVKLQLAGKHPPGHFRLFDAPLIFPPYAGPEVQAAIYKLGNGTAPGWSGWTKELLNAACAPDPRMYDELGEFIVRLQSCTDPRLSEIARVGKLIALDNSKSAEDAAKGPDARPITISELFSKLLGTLAMDKSNWSLHPCQRGVNHPGGITQAVYEIQNAYDTHPDRVIATFDVKNAFNTLLRAAIRAKLESMGANALHLLEYFRWMYGSKSLIFNRAKEVLTQFESAEGVRQGDMPASLFFSLVFTDAAIASGHFLSDILNQLWLYLDDITLVATVQDIISYKLSLTIELEKIGLKLNMTKCRVLADRCSAEEIALLVQEGFQIDRGCTRVLGCPVGSPDACRNWVLNKLGGWAPFWERLRHARLHPLTALTLLSKCGNVKFEHLARSLPFTIIEDPARQFDSIVSDTARVIIGASKGEIPDYVLRIVLHLKPYIVVSPVLFDATVKISNGQKVNIGVAQLTAITEFYQQISLPPFVGLMMSSAQGKVAADTVRITCGSFESGYSGHEIAQGLRLRCGHSVKHLPHTCSCGFVFGDNPSPVLSTAHLLCCEHNSQENKTTRHHLIAKAVIDVLSHYRITSIFNQWRLDPFRRLIPDMHVISLKKQALTDVTVVNDVAANDGTLLDQAAHEKHGKYDDFADSLNMSFWALPVSTFGKLHHEFDRFIEHIANSLPSARRRDFRQEVRTAIQHALLVGNSRVVDKALERLSGVGNNWFRKDC